MPPRTRGGRREPTGPSSSEGLSQQPNYYQSTEFTQRVSQFLHKKIVSGRSVKLGTSYNQYLKDYIRSFGWTPVLDLPSHYYPDLVRYFYATLTYRYVDDDRSRIQVHSHVKGVNLTLDVDILAAVLGCSREGEKIYFSTEGSHQAHITEEASSTYYQTFSTNSTGRHLVARDILPQYRLLNKFLVHNILPRAGHFEEVKPFQSFILHCFATGRRLCLPYILLHVMTEATTIDVRGRSLPYGALLTALFNRTMGLQLTNERQQETQGPICKYTVGRMLPLTEDSDSPDELAGDEPVNLADDEVRPPAVHGSGPSSSAAGPSDSAAFDVQQFQAEFSEFRIHTNEEFNRLDGRLTSMSGQIDERFSQLDQQMDRRFTHVDQQFMQLNDRLDQFFGVPSQYQPSHPNMYGYPSLHGYDQLPPPSNADYND